MLHYDDPTLDDLYFIDPQWLCSMLACVVTIQEKNPFQKNGDDIYKVYNYLISLSLSLLQASWSILLFI